MDAATSEKIQLKTTKISLFTCYPSPVLFGKCHIALQQSSWTLCLAVSMQPVSTVVWIRHSFSQLLLKITKSIESALCLLVFYVFAVSIQLNQIKNKNVSIVKAILQLPSGQFTRPLRWPVVIQEILSSASFCNCSVYLLLVRKSLVDLVCTK